MGVKMVKIVTDSGSDMPRELCERLNIGMVPFNVILGDKEYLDGVNLDPSTIYKFVAETKKLPKTAAIAPAFYRENFEKFVAGGAEVVYIALSSGISASHQNAVAAAAEMKNVFVVNSKSLSSGVALLVLYACELRDKGMRASEIVKNVERRVPDVQCSFLIDKLEFLHKGGRCTGLERFASTLLKIKPTIIMEGKMRVGKKYVGNWANNLQKYIDDTFMRYPEPDLKRIFITYTTANPEVVERVKERVLKKFPFAEVLETVAQGTITSHCGKNTLGILYLSKDEKEGLS
jgi:DegV family protein with EDD domain